MLRRRPLGEGVGVAGRDIEPIQIAGLLHQLLGCLKGKLLQEPGHEVPPGLLAQVEVEGLDGLLGRLLGGEAGPLVPSCTLGISAISRSFSAWRSQSRARFMP
ncbi:hypothetical protein TT_C0059 [Thermus thermophilus HB27]|uniref:Uncharacterized protein n=1 Tax=Thermus thermophilus (strain ATCC BAA-163 / DSM 7039 / HB27) TaxID=262724 RepID=Q72LK0_THET2|nr:hypothetical protein TT_C0059 [Thermus thermophilus HB27]